LAAEPSFADQAHLSRTIRAHLGNTPTALRAALQANATAKAPPSTEADGWDGRAVART
jgi:AraC-like DNA-binding protein